MKWTLILAMFSLFLIGADKPRAADSTDRQKLQGTWQFVQEFDGDSDTSDEGKLCRFTFDGDKFMVKREDKIIFEGTFTADPAKSPPQIDLMVLRDEENEHVDQKGLAIYQLDGDKLKLCANKLGEPERPTEFTTKGTDYKMVVMERVEK